MLYVTCLNSCALLKTLHNQSTTYCFCAPHHSSPIWVIRSSPTHCAVSVLWCLQYVPHSLQDSFPFLLSVHHHDHVVVYAILIFYLELNTFSFNPLHWMEPRLWSPWGQRTGLQCLAQHNVEYIVNWIEVLKAIYHIVHCSCEDTYIYNSIFTWKIHFGNRSFKTPSIMFSLYALIAYLSQEYFIDSNYPVPLII